MSVLFSTKPIAVARVLPVALILCMFGSVVVPQPGMLVQQFSESSFPCQEEEKSGEEERVVCSSDRRREAEPRVLDGRVPIEFHRMAPAGRAHHPPPTQAIVGHRLSADLCAPLVL